MLTDTSIDLYVALSAECDIACRPSGWSRSLLDQALLACRSKQIRHFWIGLPCWLMEDGGLLEAAGTLRRLKRSGHVDQITLQCHLAGLERVRIPPAFHDFNLSLLVCEAPVCGVEPPQALIRTYLRLKPLFRRVSLTDPAPFTCKRGLDAGAGIREECLVHPDLASVLPTGQVHVCPLGRFPPIGHLDKDALITILSSHAGNHASRPLPRPGDPDAIRPNICIECLAQG